MAEGFASLMPMFHYYVVRCQCRVPNRKIAVEIILHFACALQEWHPHLDQHSVIVLQLLRFDLKYAPRSDHAAPGKLTTSKGKALAVGEGEVFGWSVVPLFEK